jgi:hypothetical protein
MDEEYVPACAAIPTGPAGEAWMPACRIEGDPDDDIGDDI